MSRIGVSLLVLAVSCSLAGGAAFAQAPAEAKSTKADHDAKKKICKQQALAKNLTGKDQNAFEKECVKGTAPQSR